MNGSGKWTDENGDKWESWGGGKNKKSVLLQLAQIQILGMELKGFRNNGIILS